MRIGSHEHKELLCRSFMATHEAYEPERIEWPALDDVTLGRLRSLQIWGTALQIERNAGVMVSGFAERQRDPLIREAVALQGFEEKRHARLLAVMSEQYALNAQSHEPELVPTERAFIDFGFGECIDSFIGFALFHVVQPTGLVPDALLTIFDRVLREEARHIVFFVNWMAYEGAQRSAFDRLALTAMTARAYGRGLLNIAKMGMQAGGGAPAAAGNGAAPRGAGDGALDALGDLSLRSFLNACVEANRARMAMFDRRLLQPRLMPMLATSALGLTYAAKLIDTIASKRLQSATPEFADRL